MAYLASRQGRCEVDDELVAKLRNGCICHPRRWSGDTHADLGGSIKEGETDALMREAADKIEMLEAALQQQGEATTPAARWRANGEPDPHGSMYDGERASIAGGDMTDDEVANALYLDPSIVNLTIAKERIRWLSRKLFTHPPKPVVSDAVAVLYVNKWELENGEADGLVAMRPDKVDPIRSFFTVPLFTDPLPPLVSGKERDWLEYAVAHMLDDSEAEDKTCADVLQGLLDRIALGVKSWGM